jgi:hypothetical protein
LVLRAAFVVLDGDLLVLHPNPTHIAPVHRIAFPFLRCNRNQSVVMKDFRQQNGQNVPQIHMLACVKHQQCMRTSVIVLLVQRRVHAAAGAGQSMKLF